MIQVRVRNIGLDALTGAPIVMLENIENTDEIYPIWIGVSEAEGIIIKQSGVETPRPLTYDLMKNIIETLGGQVKYVAVIDKKDNAYIAEIVIDKDGEELHIDARPSDAINIALRFDAPIYLEENVVQKVSLKEIQEAIQKAEAKEKAETEKEVQEVKETATEVVEEPEVDKELEQFRKMLENIKPEDFAIKPEDKKDKN
ncbi:bifunctional nuclease family protein [Persephonella sp. KM09-Lau-8]|uniref:bifunctional nuclease family protein n=1 Tax=Persephonella sp. KM09-Lau-8 TaxID=1158345 RepID=UPI000495ADF7|nr:bifunctional nuclease family protein [Persephonella sp. KM09-Lau-8]